MSFSNHDRQTVAKLLSLVGSNHDGEALTAARKADEIVRKRGAQWRDILFVKSYPGAAEFSPRRHTAESEHISIARDLLQRGKGVLTKWEHGFLLGIMAYRTLKPRQLDTLCLISRKVAVSTTAA